MKREEALQLVGQQVSAWTAANGEYVGTLLEVLPTRPWRAKVLITGVLSSATHYERGGVCRRGFRPGEELEVGGSSIKPNPKSAGGTYLEAVQAAQADSQRWFEKDPQHRDAWAHKGTAEALVLVIEAEQRRLAGEPWKLVRPPFKSSFSE
jgi:hypothetical protein